MKRIKMTPEQADEIRRLKGRVSQWKVAKRFGVSQSTVSQIQRGVAWVPGARRRTNMASQ